MKNFKFSVQSVLDLKTKFEDNEKAKLLKLKNELNALFYDLDLLKNHYKATKRTHVELSFTGTTPAKFAEMLLYIKDVDKRIAIKNSEIVKMQERVDAQAEILKEINKEVKMLEKLREKQLWLHGQAENKENELAIEDFLAGKRLRD